jgi:hypothetical protein
MMGVGNVARFHLRNLAAEAVRGGYGQAELLPVRLRRTAEGEAQQQFVVAAQQVVDVRLECA